MSAVTIRREEGLWVAEWPLMKTMSSGYTPEDALVHLIEAVDLLYKCCVENDLPLPHETIN